MGNPAVNNPIADSPTVSGPIAILGAGGFVGRSLVQALAGAGQRVIAVGRRLHLAPHPLVEQVQANLLHPQDFADHLSGCRTVVHLATSSTPGTSAAQPLREVTTNLHVTAALLEALHQRSDVELLYASSGGSVYASASTPSTETAPVRPRSYHGAAKLANEHFIQAWCEQTSNRATVIRPSNVYGPGQPQRPGFGLIPAAFAAVLDGRPLQVWGDGSARRDYVFIDDLIRLCSAILERRMPPGMQVVNCCSGTSVSINELLTTIESTTGRYVPRDYRGTRTVDASTIAMDAGLAEQLYGWRHETSLSQGLMRTWEAFLEAAD